MRRMLRSFLLLLALIAGAHRSPVAAQAPSAAGVITVDRVHVARPAGRRGRTPIFTDAVEAARVRGLDLGPSAEGDSGGIAWREVRAEKDGSFAIGRGGWALARFEAKHRVVMLLVARAHSVAYVNGRPCPGDPYDTGWVRVPVVVEAGANEILFRGRRGRLRFRLEPFPVTTVGRVAFNPAEATRPDLRVGTALDAEGAVVVLNGEERPLTGLEIVATLEGEPPTRLPVPRIPPLSARKIPFSIRARAPTKPGKRTVALRLTGLVSQGAPACRTEIVLDVVGGNQPYRQTFRSAIDDSVQYYAVHPAAAADGEARDPAFVLSLHGASVWAENQARSYGSRSDRVVVAPTNRRPYGFDWEDWGRLDALEVFAHAKKRLKHDPSRVYLTGHSMGGHGTWHLGVTFPDRFAAIGPSAGWISFRSYAGGRSAGADPVAAMFDRAWSPSDTLRLKRNLAPLGVYVLHGDADDNVPVTEARTMRRELRGQPSFGYHEQKGAKHWWDGDPAPGAACLDWAPMYAFFAKHRRPTTNEVDRIEFHTASPGVSATCHWVRVDAQHEMMKPSSAIVRRNRRARRLAGQTRNVARLAFEPDAVAGCVNVSLDGQSIALRDAKPNGGGRYWFRRDRAGVWHAAARPSRSLKGAHRYGPFRNAFRNRMVFVYATGGSERDRQQALAKARFDAETFWFRGNGSVDVVADTDVTPADVAGRNVILYGRRDTHGWWRAVLAGCPIDVSAGRVTVGDQTFEGDDLATVFCWPRAGSDTALVGVVASTGAVGARLAETLPYFVSGVAYPDFAVMRASLLERGLEGIEAAGFFAGDWSLENADVAFKPRRD